MRPRPMTAENRRRGRERDRVRGGFNEAAADDRGKPRAVRRRRPVRRRASMRPRPMTAENRW